MTQVDAEAWKLVCQGQRADRNGTANVTRDEETGRDSTASTTGEKLREEIAARLRREGRLSFADCMDMALYAPAGGYYAGGGRPGSDYRTTPTTHPLFGALIALQLEQMWRVLGSPRRFFVVEPGSGDGALCRDVISFATQALPRFATVLRYLALEPSAGRLLGCGDAAGPSPCQPIVGSALALPVGHIVGCVISNELIDAFPVHRVVTQDGGLRECYVVAQGDRLGTVLAEPSSPDLAGYFERLGIMPPEGCLVEVNLCAGRFIREAARALKRGFVITIDYGLPAEELYVAARPAGTLRSFRRQRVVDATLDALGEQDITAHVDFSSLVKVGAEAGLSFGGLAYQRDFLRNLGHGAFLSQLEGAGLPAARQFENRFAMLELVSMAGLGSYRVLAQYKGLHDPALDGFNPCNDRKRLLVSGGITMPLRTWTATETLLDG